MKDFENKKIKISLNSNSGWVTVSGAYIKEDGNFIVIYNPLIKKIQYFSMFFIKTVEIIGEYKEDDNDEE